MERFVLLFSPYIPKIRLPWKLLFIGCFPQKWDICKYMTYGYDQFKQNETILYRSINIDKIVLMKFLAQNVKN